MKVSELLNGVDAFREEALGSVAMDSRLTDEVLATHIKVRYMLAGALLGIAGLLKENGGSVLEFDVSQDELLGFLGDKNKVSQ